jgi:hypothetical protein
MIKWEAKKKHMERRVDTYSHLGVSEVIYRDEWKKRKKPISYNQYDKGIDFKKLLIGFVIIISILYFIIKFI